MDSQTKSAIKQLVLDLRQTLEDELTIILRRYGIFTDHKRLLARSAPSTGVRSDLKATIIGFACCVRLSRVNSVFLKYGTWRGVR